MGQNGSKGSSSKGKGKASGGADIPDGFLKGIEDGREYKLVSKSHNAILIHDF